jgi:hypothetical protein
MELYYDQVLKPITKPSEREAALHTTGFLKELTAVIANNLGDYYDTVREQS